VRLRVSRSKMAAAPMLPAPVLAISARSRCGAADADRHGWRGQS
jgi:hypothetical protein